MFKFGISQEISRQEKRAFNLLFSENIQYFFSPFTKFISLKDQIDFFKVSIHPNDRTCYIFFAFGHLNLLDSLFFKG